MPAGGMAEVTERMGRELRPALGAGGMELVQGTDIRIAMPGAKLGVQEVKWVKCGMGNGEWGMFSPGAHAGCANERVRSDWWFGGLVHWCSCP